MQFPYLQDHRGQDLDQVQLTGMLLSCVIGIFPNERHRKQPVTIDLCLYLNTRKAAASTSIHDTIDYGAAVKEVTFILEQCEFLLIESAVDTVCRYFLATYRSEHHLPQVDAVVVRISKPSALTHGIVPSIQIQRRREEVVLVSESGQDQVIHESSFAKLRLKKLSPGDSFALAATTSRRSAAMAVGRLHLNGEALKSRAVVANADSGVTVATISNEQTTSQLILTLDA